MRRLCTLLCAAALALLAGAATAGADVFGPISLVSESATQQAVYAHDPAISGDGRFVAFDGFFGAETGVFRRDLATGAVELVAGGEEGTPAGSAELPSISENGRYVSFTTTAALTPGDTNEAPDVYVRDMEPQPGEPQYILASAASGSAQGLTYEPLGRNYGSIAAGRSALSADGKKVVFVTTAISNLANPAETNTPALQVAVRDLQTRETQLVSSEYDQETGQEVPGKPVAAEGFGAVYIPGSGPPAFPFSPRANKMTPAVGASISADGSTVAWMGQDISKQAKMLSGETVPALYTEPLWRRITDGPAAPTRRVTGGSDPASPACIASGESTLSEPASLSDPCQGPFATPPEPKPGIFSGGTGDVVPRLSGDGYTVAFIANAGLLARGSAFGIGSGEAPSDLYAADMHEGLTRVQALRPLTEFASGKANQLGENAPIADLGVSPDGAQIAFTTQRTQFPLGSPAYVSAPAAVPGMLELFDVNLADDTLTRVSHGFEGGASEAPHREVGAERDPYGAEAGALSPSFSRAGTKVAFSSTAANLAYGDGNTPQNGESSLEFDGSDAFVTERVLFSGAPTPQEVSGAPAAPALVPAWELGVTARSLPNGSVQLYVQAPSAGKLLASAQGAVPIRYRLPSHTARRTATRRHLLTTTVATRAVARATKAASDSAGGPETLALKLAPAYSALASARGGLSATVKVTFSAPGHAALRQEIEVTFLRTAKSHAPKHRGTKKKPKRKR
jgi:hypothetical protein